MTLSKFKKYIDLEAPPKGFSKVLQALWYDAKGDWDTAHSIVQEVYTTNGSWVHAYLHRKEGDLANALYWYNRAGKTKPDAPLEEEWEQITNILLNM